MIWNVLFKNYTTTHLFPVPLETEAQDALSTQLSITIPGNCQRQGSRCPCPPFHPQCSEQCLTRDTWGDICGRNHCISAGHLCSCLLLLVWFESSVLNSLTLILVSLLSVYCWALLLIPHSICLYGLRVVRHLGRALPVSAPWRPGTGIFSCPVALV